MGIPKVVGRSLVKRLTSLSSPSLVKGGAVLREKFWRALIYDDKEISIDNQRPQLNGSKECQDLNSICRVRKGTRNFSMTKRTQKNDGKLAMIISAFLLNLPSEYSESNSVGKVSKRTRTFSMKKSLIIEHRNNKAKLMRIDKVVSRSLTKRLISLPDRSLVKGRAVLRTKFINI